MLMAPFVRFAPMVFVMLWSTGFIVARYGTADSGPLTFLSIRVAIAASILWVLSRIAKEASLTRREKVVQMISGLGIHGLYLGGVFVAIDLGLPSGVSALIAALHPVVTTVFGRVLLREVMNRRRVLGVVLGCIGVVVVVVERGGATDSVSTSALIAMGVAVLGMSAGTLLQRQFAVSTPLLGGTAWQYLSSALLFSMGAMFFEDWEFSVTPQSLGALAWSVGILSLGAILIMLWLLKRQAASQVSSLFFLTPALSTIQGALLFGESLGVLSLIGLVVALLGVWLATTMSHSATT
ncbi:MAG: EamA family transporter [Actinobacteria bacterium]|nr:EamA family transporter [Actinomycetota bacterium]